MAEIKPNNILFSLLTLISLLLSISYHVIGQASPQKTTKKRIELIYADENVRVKDASGREVNHILGHVLFRHNDVTMKCDSALYTPSLEQITAFSHVNIEQGDTLDLFGDYLFYDGKTEQAIVRKNVELVDKETHLYTDALDYDVRNKIARYNTGGRITNADNTLTSVHGVYYAEEKLFHFKDDVKIVNPDYVMTADTMDYNTLTETSFFTGPTELKGDSLYLYCEKGWYDTKNEVTSIWKKALIDNRKQIVTGDSLFFNDSTGYGEAFRNVVIQDTVNKIALEGNYAWYYKQPERFLVTDKAVFIQISKNDSLFMHADTINSITVMSDTSSYRLTRAYYKCRIFSKGLQGMCDSISYSFQDSVIRFYREPILWSEENQLTSADSLAIFTKNRQAERLELYNAAFITSQVDSVRYNQIKGRTLTGYFVNNELEKVDINGNGESLYYLIDKDKIAGVNHSKCARIEAKLKDGEVVEITDFGTPEGVIDPPALKKTGELRLEGFSWLNNIRPKKKTDIFLHR
ncbi:MAG TPA: OstA-like protein [Bacteroidales bacterium]|nr:OstA-like protein [Bacteroidales bacterium]